MSSYMRGRTLCRRLYVVPRNVRTAARRRARGAFGAIAKAWSQVLTEEQRQAWIVAAAKVESHPRLWQSGPLFGEMHFQGINSARARIGRGMLLWPPERVVFGPNPVAGVAISYVNGQARLRLKVTGPVTEDIMVFGQAPCSAGRKKWRHGSYLGLLPAPERGECDITEMYVRRYGQPEPGKQVFIRTRQQKDGWEGGTRMSAQWFRSSPKPEGRNPKAERGLARWAGTFAAGVCAERSMPGRPRIRFASPLTPVRCAMHKGVVPDQYRSTSQAIPVQCRRGTWSPGSIRAVGRLWRRGVRAKTCRKAPCRELWRGG